MSAMGHKDDRHRIGVGVAIIGFVLLIMSGMSQMGPWRLCPERNPETCGMGQSDRQQPRLINRLFPCDPHRDSKPWDPASGDDIVEVEEAYPQSR